MGQQVDNYLEAEVHRMLTEHPDLAEQGITLSRADGSLVLSGEVASLHRRDLICRLVTAKFPEVSIRCDLGVTRAQAPDEVEDLT
jgi:hypothetical protein